MNHKGFRLHSDLRIVLVGKTGSGKSASGNTILGKREFEEDALPESVTQHCQSKSSMIGGKRVTVVDTPGIFDTSESNEQRLKELEKCVLMSVPGPHVFLLVIRLGRYTEEERNTVKWIQRNFGEDSLCYTVILFTHLDQIKGKTLENFISEGKDLLQLIDSCGGRYLAFNNNGNSEEKHNQVRTLFRKIAQMVEKNGGGHYTNEMYEKAQSNKIKQIKEIALGVTSAVGTTGAVVGGVALVATELLLGPALLVGGGAALAIGTGIGFLVEKFKK